MTIRLASCDEILPVAGIRFPSLLQREKLRATRFLGASQQPLGRRVFPPSSDWMSIPGWCSVAAVLKSHYSLANCLWKHSTFDQIVVVKVKPSSHRAFQDQNCVCECVRQDQPKVHPLRPSVQEFYRARLISGQIVALEYPARYSFRNRYCRTG